MGAESTALVFIKAVLFPTRWVYYLSHTNEKLYPVSF